MPADLRDASTSMGGGGGRTADDLEGMADHPTIGTPDKGELSPAPSDQVCITAQTDIGPIWDDLGRSTPSAARVPATYKTMFLAIALLVAISAAFIIHKERAAGRSAQASLGWMSPQWLAEHRASHPS